MKRIIIRQNKKIYYPMVGPKLPLVAPKKKNKKKKKTEQEKFNDAVLRALQQIEENTRKLAEERPFPSPSGR